MVVTGVRRGSVIVGFDLITALEVKLSTSDVQNSVINALKSSAPGVDLNITSVKVRNVFKLTAELNSWIFNSSLYDPGSDAWAYTSTKIITTVVPRMRRVLSEPSFDMTVVGFQRGSVVVRMMCGFNGNTSTDERALQTALQDTICKHLDITAIATLKRISQISTAPGEGWKVATIVL
ncbi:unnamed protein product [Coregonus sp. 'balchen']|nr:unnamed protein product [Coregonus sp. 'balchen']